MHRCFSGAALAALLASVSPAAAATYYVSATGSDANACAQTAPCRQIRRALTLVVAGDTILVADGSYLGFDVRDLVGAAGRPITIKAQGSSAQVVPTTDRPDNRDTIFITYSSYIVVDGLRSFNATRAAVRVDSSPHVTIRNSVFGNNTVWGIFTDFSDDLLIENNECYGSVQQHGIYVSNSGDRPVVRGNRVHDNRDSGIQLNADLSQGGDGLITGALIEDNVIYNNGAGGGGSINLDGVQDSIVRNNLLYNNLNTGIVNYQGNGAAGPERNAGPQQHRCPGGVRPLCDADLEIGGAQHGAQQHPVPPQRQPRQHRLPERHRHPRHRQRLQRHHQRHAQRRHHPLHPGPVAGPGLRAPLDHGDAAALFVDPANANYHLSATSPAIDRGQAQANVPDDIEHRARPVGVTWDLGAYEGATAPPPPGSVPVVWASLVGVDRLGQLADEDGDERVGQRGSHLHPADRLGRRLRGAHGFGDEHIPEIGLSKGNTNASDAGHRLCDVPGPRGATTSREPSVEGDVSGPSSRATSCVWRSIGGVVKYSRNGTVFYTSAKTPSYPLLVDTALYTHGATLKDAVISGSGSPPLRHPASAAPAERRARGVDVARWVSPPPATH